MNIDIEEVRQINRDFNSVFNRFSYIKIQNETNLSVVSNINKSIDSKRKDVDAHSLEIALCKKAISVLQKITNDRNLVARKEIENMINHALASIFIGEIYTVRIDEEPHGTKYMKATLVLVEDNGKERSLTNGSGDGIKQIISFIANILIIKFTGCSRVFISDELFDRLSPEYARIMSDILSELAEKLDFQFIMIEHNSLLWSNEHVTLITLKKTPDKGLVVQSRSDGAPYEKQADIAI